MALRVKYNKSFQLWFTPEQHEHLVEAAGIVGLELSPFVRQAVVESCRKIFTAQAKRDANIKAWAAKRLDK
jgi:uncharacterized protein (DUF1778 family)